MKNWKKKGWCGLLPSSGAPHKTICSVMCLLQGETFSTFPLAAHFLQVLHITSLIRRKLIIFELRSFLMFIKNKTDKYFDISYPHILMKGNPLVFISSKCVIAEVNHGIDSASKLALYLLPSNASVNTKLTPPPPSEWKILRLSWTPVLRRIWILTEN